MSDNRVIPTPAPSDLPTYKLLFDGEEMSGEYHLISIRVLKAINKIPMARIILLDGSVTAEDFELSNSGLFVPGKEVEILTGYHSDDTSIFKGIITAHGIKARKNKASQLIIDCKDKAVRMSVGRKNAYYKNSLDSEIIEEIIGDYELTPDVAGTSLRHKEMVKYYSTDWDFIVTRAEANGMLVITDDGTVTIKAPDTSQDPVLSLIYGSTMLEFEAAMDATAQLRGVTCASWDFANQELLVEESESPDFTEQGNLEASALTDVIGLAEYPLCHSGQVIDEELKAWANATLLKSRLAKIVGRVKCQGFGGIKPGSMLALDGVGDRFNGPSFVTTVQHQFTKNNWETDIQFGMPSRRFIRNQEILEPPAGGLLPSVQGLQIGIATQLADDPDGEDRVMVRIPVIDAEDEGIWARVATLDGGNKRGAFFRPEIGDEVVLGFLNDDPRDAVILGMLNSSAKPAPITASDDNNEKGFVTRSEIKLIFDDDKKSVTIETPNGNTVTMSDETASIVLADENSNTVEMNKDGISLESSADLTIKASGNITIEGTDISAKAGGKFKAEGSSGAELSTGATAVLKGSMVQIN